MSSEVARRSRGIVVERSYEPNPDACEQALQLLLKSKKAAGTSGGADAGKEKNDFGETSIQQRG